MATAYDTANIIIPKSAGYKSGSLYGWNPQTSGLVDFAVTRAGATATRVNEAGLIESVAANVPRIDWAEGGICPSLLVEPQRTNLITQSNDFTSYIRFGGLLTSNFAISPDGTTNATRFAGTGPGPRLGLSIPVVAGQSYTFSLYMKNNGGSNTNFAFSIHTQVTGSSFAITSEWIRYTQTLVATNTETIEARILQAGSTDIDVLIYGFQVEAGAYLTSYIPTSGTTETCNADVIQKTGIASLLGQSAGSFAIKAKLFDGASSGAISISANNNTDEIRILFSAAGGSADVFLVKDGAQQIPQIGFVGLNTPSNFDTIALSFATNNFNASANGATAVPRTYPSFNDGDLNTIKFSRGGGQNPFYGRISFLSSWNISFNATEVENIASI